MELSRERAEAVKNWLVKNGNIQESSISVKGLGERYPVAPNTNENGADNPVGRALNRRVSIVVENPSITATR
jgi:OOP family OmpA-OmpF porin